MARPDRITLISIYHLAVAVIFLLIACSLLVIPAIVAAATQGAPDAQVAVPVVTIVMLVLMAFFLIYAIANGAAAWGLWKLQPWGRWLAIVVSVIGLFVAMPISTIIRALILWLLFQPETEAAFRPGSAI